MNITIIAGARPNFIKIAPIISALGNQSYRLVHTGQHFDEKMSKSFFRELNIPEPHKNLNCGGGTQAEQTAAIMVAFEKELIENPADLVIVVGDVTSTMACTLVAKKLNIKVAHIEAGIRSFDLSMPEEINRMVTDSIADYFFTTTQWASNNLIKTGIPIEKIHFVGNVMIDTLLNFKGKFTKPFFFDELYLEQKNYWVLTLHRPSNVDDVNTLSLLIETISKNSNNLPILFPVHPRTRKNIQKIANLPSNLILIDPLGYLYFNYLVMNAKGVITDSGGITEEATVLGIPCITLRDSTERPETVTIGTNELVGSDVNKIAAALHLIIANQWKKGAIPEKWDGKTAERIVVIINNLVLTV